VFPIRLDPNPYHHKANGSVVIEWRSFMINLRVLHWRGWQLGRGVNFTSWIFSFNSFPHFFFPMSSHSVVRYMPQVQSSSYHVLCITWMITTFITTFWVNIKKWRAGSAHRYVVSALV
jgi:hypothetical protein